MGLEVEIVVSVCPLPEHHNVDSDALFLHLDIQEGTVNSIACNHVTRCLQHKTFAVKSNLLWFSWVHKLGFLPIPGE